MNETWMKYIQPIINSPGFDGGMIWDPFLKKYPEFNTERRIQVEDALVSCSFDSINEDLVNKALAIAGILYRSKLASKRLSRKMKEGLRKQAKIIGIDQNASRYYVFAFSTFGVKEAVPSIKLIMYPLMQGLPEHPIYLDDRSHRELFRACCISLLLLGDSEAESLFTVFIENDLRMNVISPDRAMWGLTDLASFWDHFGLQGFRKIAAALQVWQEADLIAVLPRLKQKTEQIRYRSDREKQEVMNLVGDLENRIAES